MSEMSMNGSPGDPGNTGSGKPASGRREFLLKLCGAAALGMMTLSGCDDDEPTGTSSSSSSSSTSSMSAALPTNVWGA